VRAEKVGLARTQTAWKKECDVTTKFGGKQRRGLTTGVPDRSPAPLHHVVTRDGDEGLEVLRIFLGEKGETLPVFSAGWAARRYLFAEAPGGGWHVKACTPHELVSLLVGPCAGVEWVALDPRPGPRSGGEVLTVMPRENFVDYLLGLTRRFAHFDGATSRSREVEPHALEGVPKRKARSPGGGDDASGPGDLPLAGESSSG
jgi:hypothetical protein